MIRILSIAVLLGLFTNSAKPQQNDTVKISPDLYLVKLADNVYRHISYANLQQWGRVEANGLILIANNKALMIDTPWNNGLTKLLHQHLKGMGASLEHAVVTHWHEDCMGGLGYLQQKFILSTSGERTYEMARQKQLPVPFIRFKDTLTFNFEGHSVECFYPGPGHTSDNIVVYLPSKKVLFGGCLVKDATAQTLGNLADADVKSWPVSIAAVKKRFPLAKVVVPGHGNSGGLDLLEHTLQLLSHN